MSKPNLLKIRFRQVISRGNQYGQQYGRYDEYQVVQGNKILSRHDTKSQAIEWCAAHKYALSDEVG